jgi:hypothetical protein
VGEKGEASSSPAAKKSMQQSIFDSNSVIAIVRREDKLSSDIPLHSRIQGISYDTFTGQNMLPKTQGDKKKTLYNLITVTRPISDLGL